MTSNQTHAILFYPLSGPTPAQHPSSKRQCASIAPKTEDLPTEPSWQIDVELLRGLCLVLGQPIPLPIKFTKLCGTTVKSGSTNFKRCLRKWPKYRCTVHWRPWIIFGFCKLSRTWSRGFAVKTYLLGLLFAFQTRSGLCTPCNPRLLQASRCATYSAPIVSMCALVSKLDFPRWVMGVKFFARFHALIRTYNNISFKQSSGNSNSLSML